MQCSVSSDLLFYKHLYIVCMFMEYSKLKMRRLGILIMLLGTSSSYILDCYKEFSCIDSEEACPEPLAVDTLECSLEKRNENAISINGTSYELASNIRYNEPIVHILESRSNKLKSIAPNSNYSLPKDFLHIKDGNSARYISPTNYGDYLELCMGGSSSQAQRHCNTLPFQIVKNPAKEGKTTYGDRPTYQISSLFQGKTKHNYFEDVGLLPGNSFIILDKQANINYEGFDINDYCTIVETKYPLPSFITMCGLDKMENISIDFSFPLPKGHTIGIAVDDVYYVGKMTSAQNTGKIILKQQDYNVTIRGTLNSEYQKLWTSLTTGQLHYLSSFRSAMQDIFLTSVANDKMKRYFLRKFYNFLATPEVKSDNAVEDLYFSIVCETNKDNIRKYNNLSDAQHQVLTIMREKLGSKTWKQPKY